MTSAPEPTGGGASGSKPDLRAQLRDVPHRPGVYVMRDRLHRVIYVGKARDLRKRLSSYFTPSRLALADLKTRALVQSVWSFEYHVVGSEAEAVLYEGRLIKEFRPKYNISFRDDKRFLLVRVHLDEPWPRFQLTRLKKADGARYFGPFAHSGALRATLGALRKKFGIRACRPLEPGERDFKHCLDAVIKNCSAPCVGRITREDYLARVAQACEFLEGASREMLAQIEEEMHAAAARLDFEKAASLRNLLEDLRATSRPVTRFVRKSLPPAHDPASDLSALSDALGLPAPPRIMECFDISNISGTHIVASMVRFRDGAPDRSAYRRYRITEPAGQDDFASMAEVVRRRYSRLLREHCAGFEDTQLGASELATRSGAFPGLIIVDGGKGQLSSACRELMRLGLGEIPVIGLAKEFEEIYRPGRPVPLRLPPGSGALHLLQRIRDEAHRFANAYHSLLMKRRVRESLLDDIPGVSESRKKALLRAFGSVERLRAQPPETIARVPGIGPKLAAEICQWLSRNRAPACQHAAAGRKSPK
ncbi:MAG: excinuclease ABC subunit UvrC [Terrimicrobiaceae bacterium]|nr:excinuclease ABC subunit UvrC [Terrimicrobiaceae bacterium]